MNWIVQPPAVYRWCCPGALFRKQGGGRTIYLTFDDGPVPEVTPQVLDILSHYGVCATFFMVGENVRRYPDLFAEVKRRGHSVGNHTMRHLQGSCVTSRTYMRDVLEADNLIGSRLFRPPHGWMRPRQFRALKQKYKVVMFDVVTRDYSRLLTPEDVLRNVQRYTRSGSVIVFHDSLKSCPRTLSILPQAIEWLQAQDYTFAALE